jgi:FK506-binding protein 4/5
MDEDFDIPEDDSGADDNPILVVGQEKEIGDEGLKKKLLRVGQGSDTPDVDDEVHGIYVRSSLI